jgi:hypothetical protein
MYKASLHALLATKISAYSVCLFPKATPGVIENNHSSNSSLPLSVFATENKTLLLLTDAAFRQ